MKLGEAPQFRRLVKLRFVDGRFVFVYEVRSGDTASEIADELLGSIGNVEMLKFMNPQVSAINDINNSMTLVICPATPSQVQRFIEAAVNKEKDPDSMMIFVDAAGKLAEQLMRGDVEGPMP